jgi:hypothetical protein
MDEQCRCLLQLHTPDDQHAPAPWSTLQHDSVVEPVQTMHIPISAAHGCSLPKGDRVSVHACLTRAGVMVTKWSADRAGLQVVCAMYKVVRHVNALVLWCALDRQ